MKQPNKLDISIRVISDAIREDVNLPVARPACWHNPRRDTNSYGHRIPDHLRLDAPFLSQNLYLIPPLSSSS